MIYRQDHIPKNTPCGRRPGLYMYPTTITIHNTGNPSSTAANERAWLTNPSNTVTASYHIVIDEREAIECLPLNENAWHAGDGSAPASGNRTSIGIEICESGNYVQALENAADLVADMLLERGWGVDRLQRHYDWPRADGYRKLCPRLMYSNGTWIGWVAFKSQVYANIAAKKAAKEEDQPMTAEEKQAFEELREKVKEQAERIQALENQRDMPAPEWAKEVEAIYAPHMDPKTASWDFWRLLTIQRRKETGKTV